ncbi:28S ribosomal protein S23, mitochondrial [Asbolus verrucosus]|uniref:Small ribosomal subunit protein mS23 n=1 Tax=Asbolus verrucosus TaxID=1661398 RepID=A0A482VQL5_ASBVE|nr:28S ribosomal protein S23, mitochondrial [Asbolus verrucosus]
MAQSRLEKIGTIYTRATGLIKSGALSWEDRPLWYDLYEAFPPKEEPRFDRPAPNLPLKKIFYEEDNIRALFHQRNKNIGATNMFDSKHKTLTQKFIDNYRKIEAQYGGEGARQQIYEEALDLLKRDREVGKEDENVSLSSTFKDAQESREKPNLKVKWRRMQSLILQQECCTTEQFTPIVLKVTRQVMEALKRQIRTICDDLQEGTAQLPDVISDRFRQSFDMRNTVSASTTSTTTTIIKKIIIHFVTLLYIHDIMLNYFRNNQNDLALDFLKQIAVSHALKGVTPMEFRIIDWFLVHYLMKNKVVSDENISTFLVYLNTLSNHIAKFYESQSVRAKMMDKLTTDKENDRENKARENYRLMKKWKSQVETLKDQYGFVEDLLTNLHDMKRTEDEESIDTLTLKQTDFIMKHFVRKRKESKSSKKSNRSAKSFN